MDKLNLAFNLELLNEHERCKDQGYLLINNSLFLSFYFDSFQVSEISSQIISEVWHEMQNYLTQSEWQVADATLKSFTRLILMVFSSENLLKPKNGDSQLTIDNCLINSCYQPGES